MTQCTLLKEYTLEYMLQLGVSPSKLVVGLPLYGRTFLLAQTDLTEQTPKLGMPAQNLGFQGPFTKENGFMGYNEVSTIHH